MKIKKDPQQVFIAPRIHSRTRSIRLTIEILILVLVLTGTIFSLLAPSNFSPHQGLENLKGLVSLKKQNLETKSPSFEERAKVLIDKKLFDIASSEKSADDFLTIQSKEGLVVILSNQKDLEFQVRTLQTLLSKAKIEGKAVALVDFRFGNLVVRYK